MDIKAGEVSRVSERMDNLKNMCSVLRKEGKNYYCLEGYFICRILVEKCSLYGTTNSLRHVFRVL